MNQIVPDIWDRIGEPYPTTVEGQDCCSSNSRTSTRAFLEILRAAKPDQQLVFQLDEASLVAAGYHVTEVKVVTYNTMDCGGLADKWKETVIQLWNPGDEPEREYMTVRKFLAIYDRVAKHIPVFYDAELRFEYGDRRRPAASYHVERLESRGALILVHLRAPVVTCKARDRKKASIAADTRNDHRAPLSSDLDDVELHGAGHHGPCASLVSLTSCRAWTCILRSGNGDHVDC